MNIGIFKELKDTSLFNSVKPFMGSIQWINGQDWVHPPSFPLYYYRILPCIYVL